MSPKRFDMRRPLEQASEAFCSRTVEIALAERRLFEPLGEIGVQSLNFFDRYQVRNNAPAMLHQFSYRDMGEAFVRTGFGRGGHQSGRFRTRFEFQHRVAVAIALAQKLKRRRTDLHRDRHQHFAIDLTWKTQRLTLPS